MDGGAGLTARPKLPWPTWSKLAGACHCAGLSISFRVQLGLTGRRKHGPHPPRLRWSLQESCTNQVTFFFSFVYRSFAICKDKSRLKNMLNSTKLVLDITSFSSSHRLIKTFLSFRSIRNEQIKQSYCLACH